MAGSVKIDISGAFGQITESVNAFVSTLNKNEKIGWLLILIGVFVLILGAVFW